MKRFIESNPFLVQTKGGSVQFTSALVIILSNFPPDHWWKRKGLEPAVIRRFSDPIGRIVYVGNSQFPTEVSYRNHLIISAGLTNAEAFWLRPNLPEAPMRLDNVDYGVLFEASDNEANMLAQPVPVVPAGVASIPVFDNEEVEESLYSEDSDYPLV